MLSGTSGTDRSRKASSKHRRLSTLIRWMALIRQHPPLLVVVVVVIVTQRIDYLPTKGVNRARRITAPRSGPPPITSSQSISGAEADAAVRVVDVRTRAAEPRTLVVVRDAADVTCSRLLLVKLQMHLLLGLQNTHLKLYPLVTVGRGVSIGRGFAELE